MGGIVWFLSFFGASSWLTTTGFFPLQPKRRGFRNRSGGRSDGEGGGRKRKQSQSGDEPDSKQAKTDSEGDDTENGTSCLHPLISAISPSF